MIIFTVLYTVIYQFASCALALFVCVGLGVSILYALILGFVLFCGYGVYRGTACGKCCRWPFPASGR